MAEFVINMYATKQKGKREIVLKNNVLSSRSLSVSGVETHKRIAQRALGILQRIYNDITNIGYSKERPFKAAVMSKDLAETFEKETGIKLKSREMWLSVKRLTHHENGTKKERGKVVSWIDKIQIPLNLSKMDVYLKDNGFVFTDYKVKFVFIPNQEVTLENGKKIVVNYFSGSNILDADAFKNGYKLLKQVIK